MIKIKQKQQKIFIEQYIFAAQNYSVK